mgnify:FL=1
MQTPMPMPIKPEGANLVILSGWLFIEQVLEIPLSGRLERALKCVIMNKRPPANPRQLSEKHLAQGHAAILTGKAMEIVLDWAKVQSSLPRVVVQGPLRKVRHSAVDQSIIDVKYLDLLDGIADPIQPRLERTDVPFAYE